MLIYPIFTHKFAFPAQLSCVSHYTIVIRNGKTFLSVSDDYDYTGICNVAIEDIRNVHAVLINQITDILYFYGKASH